MWDRPMNMYAVTGNLPLCSMQVPGLGWPFTGISRDHMLGNHCATCGDAITSISPPVWPIASLYAMSFSL